MYLVTGGAGFIGSNVVAALARRGARVVVDDTFGCEDKWRNVAKHDVYDFITPAELDGWLEANARSSQRSAVEGVIHMGAISATTERDSDLIVASNFQLSCKLWQWCSRNEVPFIYASSAATYGDGTEGFSDRFEAEVLGSQLPLNPYGWSKLAFDRRVYRDVNDGELAPPKWAGLRFFNVYGPNEYHKGSMRSVIAVNMPKLVAGDPMRLFRSYRNDYRDGEQKRDFVYVKDCVSVILWMLDNQFPSSIYNVGSGRARTWLDLGRAMMKAGKIEERFEFIDMPETLRERYQYFTEANSEKLRRAGYQAAFYSLEDGVADYVENYLLKPDPFA
ncbi:MAG: ADP-glyceromanno-heptose 6-epimerase [Hyphomicrobiaceae bacterium]